MSPPNRQSLIDFRVNHFVNQPRPVERVCDWINSVGHPLRTSGLLFSRYALHLESYRWTWCLSSLIRASASYLSLARRWVVFETYNTHFYQWFSSN